MPAWPRNGQARQGEDKRGKHYPKPDEPEPNRGYDGSLMDGRESDHGYGDA